MKLGLKDTGLAEVCEVIAANMGLHFPVDRWNMLTRNLTLAAAELGFQHFDEFTHWLLSARLEKEQIKILASYLTISGKHSVDIYSFSSIYLTILPIFLLITFSFEKLNVNEVFMEGYFHHFC